MKIKYYLRGLGTGIIFTAIVMMIIYSYRTMDSKIIEQARELGMIMPGEAEETDEQSSDENNETDAEADTETTEVAQADNAETDTAGEADETEEATSQADEATEDTETEETEEITEIASDETEEVQQPAGDEITFTVSGGMYSETVSQKLYELGVVDNATDFNQYLVENGYAARIKTGTYTFTTGMSYEEAAGIIAN